MNTLVETKRAFYRQPAVAADYDRQRFGGASGHYVNQRELSMVVGLLPRSVNVLADVGCGTGRLLQALRQSLPSPLRIGLDASLPMLGEARTKGNAGFVQADAFGLPLRNETCDAVTTLRVLFHFDDVRPLLKEMRRITKTGGRLVCDTSVWSPRGLLPLGHDRWGARVATIDRTRFRALAQAAGWRVVEERSCFLISPYMYRRLPLPLAQALEGLERHLPQRLMCRVFWALEAR